MKKWLPAVAAMAVILGAAVWGYFHFVFDRPSPVDCSLPLKPRCLAEAARQNSEPDGIACLLGLERMLPGEAFDDAVVDALAVSGDAEAAAAAGLAAKLGQLDDAMASLKDCSADLSKLAALTEITARQAAAGDGTTLKTLDQVQAIVDHMKGTADYAAAQGWLATAEAALGDGDAALATLGAIESRRARAFALARVAVALARAGQS